MELCVLCDPDMFEGVRGGGPIVFVEGEQVGDEIFGVLRDVLPGAIVEREVTRPDLAENLLV